VSDINPAAGVIRDSTRIATSAAGALSRDCVTFTSNLGGLLERTPSFHCHP